MVNRTAVFWVGLAIATLGSLISIAQRHRIESHNKAYALALEAAVVRQAAAADGVSFDVALNQLKSAGLTTVVLNESTIGEQIDSGELSAADAQAVYGFQRQELATMRGMPIGLDEETANAIRRADLLLIARLSNHPSIHEQNLIKRVRLAARLGAIGVLPLGEQVPGFRSRLKAFDAMLQDNNLHYISAEFAKISGDATMVAMAPENTIRLHAAQALELDRLSPGAVEERFAKAFGERSIRILMLRPLDAGADSQVAALGGQVRMIAQTLRKEGGSPARPRPFEEAAIPTLLFAIIGLGIALCSWWSLSDLGLNSLASAVIAILVLAACVFGTGRLYVATFSAMLFPLIAYQVLAQRRGGSVLALFLLVACISFVGGLTVAGLLNSLKFYVRAEQFFGVKPAHFLPMPLMAWVMMRGRFDFRAILSRPLTYAALGIGLVLMGVLVFMMARTGNDNPGAVSGLELQLRSLLEKLLIVRPRTKEFIIGHPALSIGLGLYLWSQRNGNKLMGVAVFLLFVGSIGLTSIVNTMCHLHTPIVVGLARIAVGLVLGLGVGAGCWAVLKPWLRRFEMEMQ